MIETMMIQIFMLVLRFHILAFTINIFQHDNENFRAETINMPSNNCTNYSNICRRERKRHTRIIKEVETQIDSTCSTNSLQVFEAL